MWSINGSFPFSPSCQQLSPGQTLVPKDLVPPHWGLNTSNPSPGTTPNTAQEGDLVSVRTHRPTRPTGVCLFPLCVDSTATLRWMGDAGLPWVGLHQCLGETTAMSNLGSGWVRASCSTQNFQTFLPDTLRVGGLSWGCGQLSQPSLYHIPCGPHMLWHVGGHGESIQLKRPETDSALTPLESFQLPLCQTSQ